VLTPGKKYAPFASASEVCADISLTCISASKAFNLAGLQSAIVVAKNPILRHKAWRGINTDEVGEPNAFAVAASTAAYREGGEWLDALNKYIYENKLYCYDFIEKNIPAIRALQSDATYLLWVDVSSLGIDSPRFCAELREATGLYVSDGEESWRVNVKTAILEADFAEFTANMETTYSSTIKVNDKVCSKAAN
jgi:cystathionine beta-lyase